MKTNLQANAEHRGEIEPLVAIQQIIRADCPIWLVAYSPVESNSGRLAFV